MCPPPPLSETLHHIAAKAAAASKVAIAMDHRMEGGGGVNDSGSQGDGGELIGLSKADGTWQGARGPHGEKKMNNKNSNNNIITFY